MTQKKLNIVHSESSCGWGGQELRILNEAKGLIARGHYISLLCPEEAPIYLAAKDMGIKTYPLPIAKKSFQALLAAKKWLDLNPVDIINTHSSTDSWLLSLATRLSKHTATVVRTRHISAPVPKNKATRWLYTKGTHYIVTTGEKIRQTLIKENKFIAEKIKSIPTGIDIKKFMPGDKTQAREKLRLPLNKIIIGVVATLRSWKGHQFLIDAFATLNDDNCHLLIVGDGPMRPILNKQISELRLQSKITMAGNQHDTTPWFQAMDIFTLPSYANEGIPQSLVQAMLCELPVVTTPVGCIEEVIEDQQTGLLVEPKSAEALNRAYKILLSNESFRKKIAQSGRIKASNTFNIEKMLDTMESTFYQTQHSKTNQI